MTPARSTSALVAAAAVALSAACSDMYAEPEGGPVELPPFSSDAGAVFPRDPPPRCPAERPRENSPCRAAGSTCEYGSSPDMQCNKIFQCVRDTAGTWWLERTNDVCRARACPANPGVTLSLDGQPCELPPVDGGTPGDADEMVCPMADGICACTTGPDGARAHLRKWVCVVPQIADCTAHRPLAGSACSGNVFCDYGSCKFKRGLAMQCKDDVWLTAGASCN